MEEADKVAIARVVIRSKQSLVAIRAKDDVLMMETMLFADEIVPTDSIEELASTDGSKTTKRELGMASQLIESLSSDFEPEKYRDEYRDQVLAMIEKKAAGEDHRRRGADRGATEGARPDGRARGLDRRGQGSERRRRRRRRRAPPPVAPTARARRARKSSKSSSGSKSSGSRKKTSAKK